MENTEFKPKSFWKRPEGITGAIFMGGILIGGGFLLFSVLPFLIGLVQTTLGLVTTLLILGAVIYMALDPKMRNLVWYMYKSVMRWVTGMFVKIDPIGILKSYVEDLKANLTKMSQQINKLRGQMHKLKELMLNNQKQIKTNLEIASQAKRSNQQNVVILKSRKAGRLQESNMKYEDLYKKMEIMYRVLTKMFENSQIMQEDIADQVEVKEQERKAIHASNSAMRSAMSIIQGDKDKRAMFDQALEAVADDVSQKVGEMERFMELSDNFMKSIDLQNGVFEEEGLKMLEKWEVEGVSKLLGTEKESILSRANNDADVLDLNAPLTRPEKVGVHKNQYDNFFED
ncbi:MAG: hypothetical protein SH818_10800 [Saprospiraceae bacterium]|nr:hypothetical protein [Saprospiraceae bacterium]